MSTSAGSSPIARRLRSRFNWTLLLGYDFFISYKRGRGSNYAQSLFNALEAEGYTCFLDQEETEGGVRLQDALPSAIKRSRVLVILAEPEIVESEYIADEIRTYLDKGRRSLLPINVDGFLRPDLDLAEPYDSLLEFTWTDESADAFERGVPRKRVLEQIRKAHKRVRVRTLSRIITAVVIAFLTLATIAASWQRWEAIQQRDKAIRQQRMATALLLATEAELVRSSSSDSVELSALLAAESLKVEPTLEGRQALYRALDLLPLRPLQDVRLADMDDSDASSLMTLFSPDGTRLAAVISERFSEPPKVRLELWDVANGRRLAVESLEFMPDPMWAEDHLYLLTPSNELLVWNATAGEKVVTRQMPDLHQILAAEPQSHLIAGIGPPTGDNWLAEPQGPLQVWDAANGRLVATVPVEDAIRAAWFADDQLYVLSGSVWVTRYEAYSLPDGQRVDGREIDGTAELVHPLMGSPSVAFVNPLLHVWGGFSDKEDLYIYSSFGDQIDPLRISHQARIANAAVSSNGAFIATQSSDNRVRVSRTLRGGSLLEIIHDQDISHLAVSADGAAVALADVLHNVHIWGTAEGRQVSSIDAGEEIEDLAFVANGSSIAVTTTDGRLRVWKSWAGTEFARLYYPDLGIDGSSDLFIEPNGDHVVFRSGSSAEPPDLFVADLRNGGKIVQIWGGGNAWEAAFNSEAGYFATVGYSFFLFSVGRGSRIVGDSDIRIWDLSTYELLQHLQTPEESKAYISPDARYAVQTGSEGEISAFALPLGQRLWQIESAAAPETVRFGPNSVIVPSSLQIKILDLQTGATLAVRQGTPKPDIALAQTGGYAASTTDGKLIEVWRLNDGQTLHSISSSAPVSQLVLSQDGSRLFVLDEQRKLRAWNLSRKRLLAELELGIYGYFDVNPDGRYLIEHRMPSVLWDLDSGERVRLGDQESYYGDMAFSTDGFHVATVDDDRRTVSVWELRQRREIARVSPGCETTDVAFSPDGRLLITVCVEDYAALWHWQVDDLLGDIEQRTTRELTPVERRLYLPEEAGAMVDTDG